jgi:NMD protein affecting ribosome stability and mRNA decay
MSEAPKLIDRAALLGAKARRHVTVEIQGNHYRFQSLNERERSEHDARAVEKTGELDLKKVAQQKRRLIVATLVDENGTRMLTEHDLKALEELDGKLTGELYDAAAKHCGIAKAKGDEHEKNSEPTPDGSSPSP